MTKYNYCVYIKVYFVSLFIALPLCMDALRVGFYSTSCPRAEFIVNQLVQERFVADNSVAPALLRMHYHDCFVRGCDASILIDSNPKHQAEKSATANLMLREYELIDKIKRSLENACPQIVSCADIIALATRDAVALAGGPKYDVPTGRRDGFVSNSNDVNLPGPTTKLSDAQKAFAAHGLTLNEMVVLLGAHTVGTAHCSFFKDRLSNFRGSGAPDPTMERTLVNSLKKICGSKNVDRSVFLDQSTSFVVDNMYYKEIIRKRGVLQIDQVIADDNVSSEWVARLAADNGFFRQQFANAMMKLGNTNVLQGNNGEIRKNCRVVNNLK